MQTLTYRQTLSRTPGSTHSVFFYLDLPSSHICERPIKEIISHPTPDSATHLVINNMIIAYQAPLGRPG